MTDEAEIAVALASIYRRKQKPLPATIEFRPPALQRVYAAVARQAWTNVVHMDGGVPWDERVPVSLTTSRRP